jgi:hypothetical protein
MLRPATRRHPYEQGHLSEAAEWRIATSLRLRIVNRAIQYSRLVRQTELSGGKIDIQDQGAKSFSGSTSASSSC